MSAQVVVRRVVGRWGKTFHERCEVNCLILEGLGAYFGIDPTLLRILFVLLALPGGLPGTLLYLILWVVMPEE